MLHTLAQQRSLVAAALALALTGCSDFTFSAGIVSTRFEIHEVRADGKEGKVVRPGVNLTFERSAGSLDAVFPVRLRLVHPGEPDRDLLLESECAIACNGSVNCTGKTLIAEIAGLVLTDEGKVNRVASRWQCKFDDDTGFYIGS